MPAEACMSRPAGYYLYGRLLTKLGRKYRQRTISRTSHCRQTRAGVIEAEGGPVRHPRAGRDRGNHNFANLLRHRDGQRLDGRAGLVANHRAGGADDAVLRRRLLSVWSGQGTDEHVRAELQMDRPRARYGIWP